MLWARDASEIPLLNFTDFEVLKYHLQSDTDYF